MAIDIGRHIRQCQSIDQGIRSQAALPACRGLLTSSKGVGYDCRSTPMVVKVCRLSEYSPDSQTPDDAVGDSPAARTSRTNLLLSATIEANGLSAPVRIRNLSEHGALIEGAALPPVGSSLILRRLQLEMRATVIWSDKGRCGVRFEGMIAVAGWRAGNWIAPVGTAAVARSDVPAEAKPASPGERGLDGRIAAELKTLQHQLTLMSGQPVGSALLQKFDAVSQTLGHLAAILAAEDKDAAVAAIGAADLRSRLQG